MSPTPDTPVANTTPFVRNLFARALRLPSRMDASAFNMTSSQFRVTEETEENNETSEGAFKSTSRLSSNTLTSNRKRRASALEGVATNRPQHSNRTPAPVANETELEDYNEEERDDSVVAGLPTHTNELEDYYEETLGTSSDASLPPSPKKLCTGLSNKVLVIDGETFLLPEGRGDVVTLERDEAMFGRLGHTMHPKVIVIDGQRFLLPRGGGEVVALGQEARSWMEEVEQRELNYIGVEEGHQHEQETDSELEGWINNYHCYMDSCYEENQELEAEEGQEEEQEVSDLDQFSSEEHGNSYVPDVSDGEQTMQNDTDTDGPSSEKPFCMNCGEYHSEPEEEYSDSDDSEPDATGLSLEQYLCTHCGCYHYLSDDEEESTEQNESEDSESDYPYNDQDTNVESNIDDGEVPPTDSGYDSEMDEEDISDSDSDSSDSSDSDSNSDESVDFDYDYNNGGGNGDANAQAPVLVVNDPILYGPTDLPEGHVRGDMMFVLNGELWGIDFTN